MKWREDCSEKFNDVVASTSKAYCLCCIPEDVICCDHCNKWYHGDCVGITPDMGQKMTDDNKEYGCPSQILPW